ncbi:MAG: ABC transporter substrate-binding protein [Pseudomonadota bacterium]
MKAVLLLVMLGSLFTGLAHAESYPDAQRIVAVGGAVTEIVYALGEEARLVARDSTSMHPPAAQALPDVGYVRRLSAEGVLSVGPDLIIGQEDMGPPEATNLLQAAAIPVVVIPEGHTAETVAEKIRIVGTALGQAEKGEVLAQQVEADIRSAAQAVQRFDEPPRVLFILSMQSGRVMAAGQDTSADAIITLAGGVNAVSGYDGYKQLTDEAITNSGADVILMMDREGDLAIHKEDVLAHPALKVLPAARNGAIVRMDGLFLLGFSVRTGEAAQALAAALAETRG